MTSGLGNAIWGGGAIWVAVTVLTSVGSLFHGAVEETGAPWVQATFYACVMCPIVLPSPQLHPFAAIGNVAIDILVATPAFVRLGVLRGLRATLVGCVAAALAWVALALTPIGAIGNIATWILVVTGVYAAACAPWLKSRISIARR